MGPLGPGTCVRPLGDAEDYGTSLTTQPYPEAMAPPFGGGDALSARGSNIPYYSLVILPDGPQP